LFGVGLPDEIGALNTKNKRARRRRMNPIAIALFVVLTLGRIAGAQALSDAERSAIDTAVRAVLESTGAPSTSIAVVRGGAIV
jgi:hypothetical protein